MWVYQRVSGHLQRSQQITRCWSKKPAMGAHIRSVIWAPCTIGHGRAWLSRYEKQKHAVPDDLWSFRISIGNYTRRNPGILMSGKNQKRARYAEKRAEELVWMLPFRGVFLPFLAKDHTPVLELLPYADPELMSPDYLPCAPRSSPLKTRKSLTKYGNMMGDASYLEFCIFPSSRHWTIAHGNLYPPCRSGHPLRNFRSTHQDTSTKYNFSNDTASNTSRGFFSQHQNAGEIYITSILFSDLFGFSLINHPAIGVPPVMEPPHLVHSRRSTPSLPHQQDQIAGHSLGCPSRMDGWGFYRYIIYHSIIYNNIYIYIYII